MQFPECPAGKFCISALLIATASTGSFAPYWILLDQCVSFHSFTGSSLIPLQTTWPGDSWNMTYVSRAGRQGGKSQEFSHPQRVSVAGTSPLHKPVAFQGLTWTLASTPRGHSLTARPFGVMTLTRGLLCAIPGCGVLSDAV